MSGHAQPRWDRETHVVARLAAGISFFSFLFYLRHGDVLLYGDAVAHINIARRVFDSRTPGLLQLGTVWLPLPHLLMVPFLLSNSMWQSGVGGSIPSMLAYVLGVVGIFRLTRSSLSGDAEPTPAARVAAWTAALIYGANPNLIYLQSTAMTESLYLAWFIWAAVYFNEFVRGGDDRPLRRCGLCLVGACLTRYDGWFLAGVVALAVLGVWLKESSARFESWRRLAGFLVLAGAAPALWISYNAIVYKNPLEFANGPYSARAIEQKTSTAGSPPHPGAGNLRMAATYFLKAAVLNMTEGSWQKLWLALLFAGAATALFAIGKLWPLGLMWLPLPFYALSVAYSGVPIFLPPWWPFSFYNVRYGIELLPCFAVFAALGAYGMSRLMRQMVIKVGISAAVIAFAVLSYAVDWRTQPISFREADVNSRSRIALEKELANALQGLPPESTLLMYLGNHVGALQRAGIPLRRVINEGNHRTWKQPFDAEGLWEKTLASPAQNADFVMACAGDPVAEKVERQNLPSLAVLHASDQPPCTLYHAIRGSQ